ncbi:thiolase family protein [Kineobactrum salinum]|uniref:Thiolase family protein n=1 Tax=Kineobactrum salinum TaxID=2708301 RepID=A0A6C0U6M8_9GAMM|nr:thiolase family protein [Kineobactrum salinum]QIB67656.1 thiolase family protein [Kineobactrum salinum]
MTHGCHTGVGVTPFGKHLERSIVSLAIEALQIALGDSGLPKGRLQACYFANALAPVLFGDSSVGQNVTAAAGLDGIPVVNVENACTSGSTAFYLARNAILAGECDVALVLGAEKMCVPGFGLINSGASELDTQLGLVTPASFALRARRHMHEFGTTLEQLAAVTVKSRRHAALNPLAQMRQEESLAQVLASPPIADPLTRSQCCPVADGAAALILASADVARGCARAVPVAASILTSGLYQHSQDLVRWETDYRSASLAYEKAGIGPEDLDLVECHDAFTISEILHYEALGLCAPGDGGAFVEAGHASLGGGCRSMYQAAC